MTARDTPSPGRGPATGTTHRCPATGCDTRVDASRLLCTPDWWRVPRALRGAVWATWRGGTGAGTPAHVAAVTAAIDAVNEQLAVTR